MNDRKIGLIGYGSIGKTIERNLSGFDVEVIPFNRSGSDGARKISELDQSLATLDVVILILPLNDESRKMFDAARLAKMKDGAFIVNTSRGGVVVESDLLDALNSGKVAGAALDVFENEPIPSKAILEHPKISLTPHIGASTNEAQERVGEEVADKLIAFFKK